VAVGPEGAYRALLASYGPQGWWPARTRFEMVAGAMLMAQTSWPRVEEALSALRRDRRLSAAGIARCPMPRLRALVRPAGLHSMKPRRLRGMAREILRAGGLDRLLSGDTAEVRSRLLSLEGVGEETADSILLYAGHRPVFVVDAYTRRLGARLGWFHGGSYGDVQAWFHRRLPRDTALLNEVHALIVTHGKARCRPRPRCRGCPLLARCPHGRAQVYPARRPSTRG